MRATQTFIITESTSGLLDNIIIQSDEWNITYILCIFITDQKTMLRDFSMY